MKNCKVERTVVGEYLSEINTFEVDSLSPLHLINRNNTVKFHIPRNI